MQELLVKYRHDNAVEYGHYFQTLPPFAELLHGLEIDPDTVPGDLEQRYTRVQTNQPATYPCLTEIKLGALEITVLCPTAGGYCAMPK